MKIRIPNAIRKIFSNDRELLGNPEEALKELSDTSKEATENLKKFSDTIDGLKEEIDGLKRRYSSIDKEYGFIKTDGSSGAGGFTDVIKGMFADFKGMFEGFLKIGSVVVPYFLGFRREEWKVIVDGFKEMKRGIVNEINVMRRGMKGHISEIVSGIGNILGGSFGIGSKKILRGMKGMTSTLMKGVAGILTSIGSPALDIMSGIATTIFALYKEASGYFNATLKLFNSVLRLVVMPLGDMIGMFFMPIARFLLYLVIPFVRGFYQAVRFLRKEGIDPMTTAILAPFLGIAFGVNNFIDMVQNNPKFMDALNDLMKGFGNLILMTGIGGIFSRFFAKIFTPENIAKIASGVIPVVGLENLFGNFDLSKIFGDKENNDLWSKIFGDKIPELDWSKFIPKVVWKDWLEALKWGNFIPSLVWINFIAKLAWDLFISKIDWKKFVSILDWAKYVAKLSWDKFVKGILDLKKLASDIVGKIVEYLKGLISGKLDFESIKNAIIGGFKKLPVIGDLLPGSSNKNEGKRTSPYHRYHRYGRRHAKYDVYSKSVSGHKRTSPYHRYHRYGRGHVKYDVYKRYARGYTRYDVYNRSHVKSSGRMKWYRRYSKYDRSYTKYDRHGRRNEPYHRSWHFKLPHLKLPHLKLWQVGGEIDETGLHFLHAGEIVLPRHDVHLIRTKLLEKVENIHHHGNITVNVNVYGDVDSDKRVRDIANKVSEVLMDYLRMRGLY